MPVEKKGRNGGTLRVQQKGDPGLPNAGRKKKLPELAELMDELLGGIDGTATESGSKEIFEALHKKAARGDTRAAEIILAYAYGKPKQSHEHTGKDGGAIEVKNLLINLPDDGGDE